MGEQKHRRSRGRPRKNETPPGRVNLQSVERALAVFKLVSEEITATLNVISATAELPFSTTHRILETLRSHDMVYFDEADQTWGIGVEAFRIGQRYARRMSFLDVGREAMRELTDETGETSNIAVHDGFEVVHISQIETHAPIRAFVPPGSRNHMHASGIGKALLAYADRAVMRAHYATRELVRHTPHTVTTVDELVADLEATRERGWAMDDEERYLGMRCIAAPIFNEFGEAVAGLSISGPSMRLSRARVEAFGPKVRAAANWVTEKSGGRERR